MTCTRPDISYSVELLSRFMQEPKELHWRFHKRLLRYIKTMRDYSITFSKSNKENQKLIGYNDSDFAGNLEDRKFTSEYLFK